MSDYDTMGSTYASTRRQDPRIAERVIAAIGDSASVVNVGAGAGSYEPVDRYVVAVEPSATMILQRPADAAPVVRARAEALPFGDAQFDAGLAILTVHHWSDVNGGLREMRRVARGPVVVLTWDADLWEPFWLVRDYFPCIRDIDRPRAIPIGDLVASFGRATVVGVPIPHDCVDGFCGAFWRRPEAYLDPRVRAGISSFAVMSQVDLDRGLSRLAADLESGRWVERNSGLLGLAELDLGYRLVVGGR